MFHKKTEVNSQQQEQPESGLAHTSELMDMVSQCKKRGHETGVTHLSGEGFLPTQVSVKGSSAQGANARNKSCQCKGISIRKPSTSHSIYITGGQLGEGKPTAN